MVVDTSNILICKQNSGAALDSCKRIKYSKVFDVVQEIHEVQEGNDHPKVNCTREFLLLWEDHPLLGM